MAEGDAGWCRGVEGCAHDVIIYAERENPCKFWQWGDIFESPRPFCLHGMVYCERKVKKDGPNQNRPFYCCLRVDPCNFFARKQQEPRVVNTGIVLFSSPLQYRYRIEETGETFNSTKTKAREAFEEHKLLKCELDKIDIF